MGGVYYYYNLLKLICLECPLPLYTRLAAEIAEKAKRFVKNKRLEREGRFLIVSFALDVPKANIGSCVWLLITSGR